MLGSFMGPLDGSIVNTVLPDITRFFETEISIAQWVPTVYLLTISCLILLYGRLGDMVGYKRIFLYGLAAFTVASILCGLSQSIWMLIVFRAVQGLAAGMMMAVGFAIVTDLKGALRLSENTCHRVVPIRTKTGYGMSVSPKFTTFLDCKIIKTSPDAIGGKNAQNMPRKL